MTKHGLWLIYALITMVAWGVWGAIIDLPANNGFPPTLGYVAWSLTMIPPAVIALSLISWKIEYDSRSILLGCIAGLLGAGGQLVLFQTLRMAPAYLVFAYVALSPLVTILMALAISRERTGWKGVLGILLALPAAVLLAWDPSKGADQGLLWALLASLVLLAWGIQGFVISYANRSMKAESIFFYMMATGILLAPIALWMTNVELQESINWGITGLWSAVAIQFLNAIGALLLVYAYRYGKAIIVSPLINAGGPVITVVVSLMVFRKFPNLIQGWGIGLAVLAAFLMALEDDDEAASEDEETAIAAAVE